MLDFNADTSTHAGLVDLRREHSSVLPDDQKHQGDLFAISA